MEMKKILTGVLTVVAIMIWSIVILKVFHKNDPVRMRIGDNMQETAEIRVRKDTLRLDYRDPFVGEFVRMKHEEKSGLQAQTKYAEKNLEQLPKVDFIFKGLICNGSGRKAMILKNGNLHILGSGETIGEFKVMDVFSEYVIVQNGKHEIKVTVR